MTYNFWWNFDSGNKRLVGVELDLILGCIETVKKVKIISNFTEMCENSTYCSLKIGKIAISSLKGQNY